MLMFPWIPAGFFTLYIYSYHLTTYTKVIINCVNVTKNNVLNIMSELGGNVIEIILIYTLKYRLSQNKIESCPSITENYNICTSEN